MSFCFSQSEVHISKNLTWDSVEDQEGPHGPHWLHSQCWAGLQRCREWWKKTAASSSPLPEDRSKWLPQCLHIWGGVGLGYRDKRKRVGKEKHINMVRRGKPLHFCRTHNLGYKKKKTSKILMTYLNNVTCSLWPTITLFRGSCQTNKQIAATQSNCLSCAKTLTQHSGIKTLWPGTTTCQMLAETMWKPGLVWSCCTQLQAASSSPAAKLTPPHWRHAKPFLKAFI